MFFIFQVYGTTTFTICIRQGVMTEISTMIILSVILNNCYCHFFVFSADNLLKTWFLFVVAENVILVCGY